MTENHRELLTPAEVADRFRIDPKTVTRWAKAGRLSSIRTLGGHRRYFADEVEALIAGSLEDRGDMLSLTQVLSMYSVPVAKIYQLVNAGELRVVAEDPPRFRAADVRAALDQG